MEDLKIIQLYWEREESAIIQTKEKIWKNNGAARLSIAV